jgi:putative transposase
VSVTPLADNGGVYRVTQLLLQPTAGQRVRMTGLLDYTRDTYNAALDERRGAWRWERRSVSKFDQMAQITGWSQPYGIQPVRGTLIRLDRAFQSFFRRVKAGQAPGFPRFKSKARWDSIEYPDSKCWAVKGNRLYLQGIGHLKFRMSKRGLLGVPKTLVVKREGRRWRAYVVCKCEKRELLPKTGKVVGLDVGVTHLLATSDDELVDNERFTRRNLDRLADAQRLVVGRKRGSGRRRKAGQRVGDIHRRIARQRRDAHHKLSRSLVDRYDLIVHEDLPIENMTRRPKPRPLEDGTYAPNGAAAKAGLNREILSASWGQLLRMLTYKAEEAGRDVIAVDPKHTSIRCAECGHTDAGNRVGTVFRCLACGHEAHADIYAAVKILRAGLALRLEREAA